MLVSKQRLGLYYQLLHYIVPMLRFQGLDKRIMGWYMLVQIKIGMQSAQLHLLSAADDASALHCMSIL